MKGRDRSTGSFVRWLNLLIYGWCEICDFCHNWCGFNIKFKTNDKLVQIWKLVVLLLSWFIRTIWILFYSFSRCEFFLLLIMIAITSKFSRVLLFSLLVFSIPYISLFVWWSNCLSYNPGHTCNALDVLNQSISINPVHSESFYWSFKTTRHCLICQCESHTSSRHANST